MTNGRCSLHEKIGEVDSKNCKTLSVLIKVCNTDQEVLITCTAVTQVQVSMVLYESIELLSVKEIMFVSCLKFICVQNIIPYFYFCCFPEPVSWKDTFSPLWLLNIVL